MWEVKTCVQVSGKGRKRVHNHSENQFGKHNICCLICGLHSRRKIDCLFFHLRQKKFSMSLNLN